MNAVFRAAIVAGVGYWPASSLALDPWLLIAWKGAGVGLLALWAALRGRWWLAAIMGFGALGDVLIEIVGLQVGAASFLVGHLLAIRLYARHRRVGAGYAPYLLVPLVIAASVWLAGNPPGASGLALYAGVLSAMAVGALQSRYVVAAIGAWLFVASDLLIFARLGVLHGSALPDLLIWPLYFAGQALIARDIGKDEHGNLHDRL